MGSEDSVKGRRPVNARELGLVYPLARTVSLLISTRLLRIAETGFPDKPLSKQLHGRGSKGGETLRSPRQRSKQETGQRRRGEEARREERKREREQNRSPFFETTYQNRPDVGSESESFGQQRSIGRR
ncbi:hypothetical protein CFAM422_009158 [Trichoderma lentiforme]|uniref:Uncharacterized protein n=1 Tax=Trichoderma lentiforme TaxID=1567552 RepID=A0A9P4X9J1_9HYPO|nr:hypothetical protein CFAM422_009158 [Trichoderma lentiforme]